MNITAKKENENLIISIGGRVDSTNSAEAEKIIFESCAGVKDNVILDVEELEYISSAGLRIILKLRKEYPELTIINANSEVYEIFDMTGFTDMVKIEKAYRRLSVDGCEIIGRGANGEVYRLDPDTIIKVYLNPDSLPDIQRERELARKAFVLGIPTAIPYDVVKVGQGYGSVFELLNAMSFAKLIAKNPDDIDKYVGLYIDLLHKIHGTEVKPGDMPDMQLTAIGWAEWLKGHIPDEYYEKLVRMIKGVAHSDHMMHGDYHVKNVMMQNDEVLLIDMDTLCVGSPIFEFASMYLAYVGFGEDDHNVTKNFLGIEYETANYIWKKSLELYFNGDKTLIEKVENKAKVIGYTRLLRRTIKRTPDETDAINNYRQRLIDAISSVDDLTV